MRTQLIIRLEPETKDKVKEIAKADRRDMNSLILSLIDKKISEVKNATN